MGIKSGPGIAYADVYGSAQEKGTREELRLAKLHGRAWSVIKETRLKADVANRKSCMARGIKPSENKAKHSEAMRHGIKSK